MSDVPVRPILRRDETLWRRKTYGIRRLRLISPVMAQPRKKVPHLFDCWGQIVRRLQAASETHLLLDFDGTLVAYSDSPEGVKLSGEFRRTLSRVARLPRVHVAIVSGRRNAVLRKYIRAPHIEYLGLFGSETTRKLSIEHKTRSTLGDLWSELEPLTVEFPGVKVENKGIGHAVHFRGTSADIQRRVRQRVRHVVSRFASDLHVIRSNHACEIVPHEVQGKGGAMRDFTCAFPPEFLTIYVGDDLTDEPAFVALRSGITIRVGPFSKTNAQLRLNDPAEVHTFLKRIDEEIR